MTRCRSDILVQADQRPSRARARLHSRTIAGASLVDHQVGELAALLARGYLRLTQTAQDLRTSRAREPHKDLDVCAATRPPCEPGD